MNISLNGLNFIKKHEGCRLTAYDDKQPKVKLTAKTKIIGVLTIGIGHTGSVAGKPIAWNTTITEKQALELLAKDVAKAEAAVNNYLRRYKWNQNEFDALVSFAYNVGSIHQLTDNGTRSRYLIAQKIVLYNKAGGEVLLGLTKRRKEEQKLFLTAVK